MRNIIDMLFIFERNMTIMFDYNIHVKIVPAQLKRGSRAKITAVISNPNKKIVYCVGAIKGYNIRQKLQPAGEGSYTLAIGIPIIAPRGQYLLEVYAVSEDNEKGPVKQIEVVVI